MWTQQIHISMCLQYVPLALTLKKEVKIFQISPSRIMLGIIEIVAAYNA